MVKHALKDLLQCMTLVLAFSSTPGWSCRSCARLRTVSCYVLQVVDFSKALPDQSPPTAFNCCLQSDQPCRPSCLAATVAHRQCDILAILVL